MPTRFPFLPAQLRRALARRLRRAAPMACLTAVCSAGVPVHAALAPTPSALEPTALDSSSTLPIVSISASRDTPQHLDSDLDGGALGSRTVLDTPFSATVVGAGELADQQPNKLGDVFVGDASVSDSSGAYSGWASYVNVRGLALDWQNGYRIDGLPFISYAVTLPYEHFERIELLKGASGFMHGFGAPGGVLQYVTKKPTRTPVRSVDVGWRSAGVAHAHADLGGRFGTGQQFGARLNATHEQGRTYNGGTIKRDSVSANADARLTRDLSMRFMALYQQRRSIGHTPSIASGTYRDAGLPATISGASRLLGADDQYMDTTLALATAGLRYRLTPAWTISTTYGQSRTARARSESTLNLTDRAGNYDESRWSGTESYGFGQWQALLEGDVQTGRYAHQLVFGAAWQRQLSDPAAAPFFGSIGSGNLWRANLNRYRNAADSRTYRANEVTQKSLFASDTMQLSSRWSVLGGLRYSNYAQRAYNVAGGMVSEYRQNGVLTPTVALLFKPAPHATLYASYVEALEQGARVDDTYANAGALLRPLRSRQFELGAKREQARWSATAALFRIERGAAYANRDKVYLQDGKSIFQGLELAGAARLAALWEVGGSLMLLDSWYAKGAPDSGNNGKRVAGAAAFMAAAHVGYTVPALPGLKVHAAAKFTGKTPVRATGSLRAPGYLLVNLGASYRTRIAGRRVTLRAALDNLANRRYWAYQYADYVKPGEPRMLSVNAKFEL